MNYLSDQNIAQKPVKDFMRKVYPIVHKDAPVDEVSKLITKQNKAVLIDLGTGYHIITKHDIIAAIK